MEGTTRRRRLRHLVAQEKLKVSVKRQHELSPTINNTIGTRLAALPVSLEQNKKETNMERDQATRRVSWKTSLLALVALSSHPLESQMTCYPFFGSTSSFPQDTPLADLAFLRRLPYHVASLTSVDVMRRRDQMSTVTMSVPDTVKRVRRSRTLDRRHKLSKTSGWSRLSLIAGLKN